jgi:hypothetical protein
MEEEIERVEEKRDGVKNLETEVKSIATKLMKGMRK